MRQRVLIVGGGLAGLAAAEVPSSRGYRVTLVESRPRLGGRASSFEDAKTGELVDNCQHVTMGCCTNFEQFCRDTGIFPLLQTEAELHFIGLDGRINILKAGNLPAPMHLIPSFFGFSYLNLADKRALASGISQLAKAKDSELRGQRFDRWLAGHRQTEDALNRFWHVVLVSALSESLDRIDAVHARKVFVDGFLLNSHSWRVQIPRVPLDQLYGETLRQHLASHGVEIRLGTGVRRLVGDSDRMTGVELRNGEILTADDYILAVPHYRVSGLLPDSVAATPEVQRLRDLETSPISSIHFWFDQPIMSLPHVALVDRLCQWVFNKSHQTSGTDRNGYYYQVVISASRELNDMTAKETIEAVLHELREIWPAARAAKVLHARRVTEHRAVFSVTPGCDALRLPQQSAVPNLQFAGDWTQTGWPGTMEGATRSGYLAAENILRMSGVNERCVAPDLPSARLSRWLWKI